MENNSKITQSNTKNPFYIKIRKIVCLFTLLMLLSSLMVSYNLFEFRVYAQDNQTSNLSNLNTKAEGDDDSALIDKRNSNQKIQADSINILATNDTTIAGTDKKNNSSDLSLKSTDDDTKIYNNNKKSYKSGYNHGCSDAKIPNPSNRYTNQPERGPSFHTPSFNKGYQDGFDKCSKNINQIPISNAGQDKTVVVGQSTILDGSKSYDPDGSIVKYSWTGSLKDDFKQCAWTIGGIDDSTSATPRFTATKNVSLGRCSTTFELRVTDNNGVQSKPDEVVITVKPVSSPPSTEDVVLSDIHTTPQNVHVNDTFSINEKITNVFNIPIEYSVECHTGSVDIKFDKEIKRDPKMATCDSIYNTKLEPHTSVVIGHGLPFISEHEGQINSQVTFGYSANGKSEQITKPFSFNVLPPKNNNTNTGTNNSQIDFKIIKFGVENHNPFVIVQGQAGGTKGAVGADAIEAYLFYTDKGNLGAFSFDENSPYVSSKFTTKISKEGMNGETCVNINERVGNVVASGHKLTITGINVDKVNRVQTVDIDTNPDQNGISNCIIKIWDSKP